ncbi:hypothetical protein KBD71_05450, partial [Candidatus Woesebacteria bacterium]|nr:hypothetical protein [Candidatus Woesebacteria bacterium]
PTVHRFDVLLDNTQQPSSVRYESFETIVTLTPTKGAVLGLMDDEENFPTSQTALRAVASSPDPEVNIASSGRVVIVADPSVADVVDYSAPSITRTMDGTGYQIQVTGTIKKSKKAAAQRLLQSKIKLFSIHYILPENAPASLISAYKITKQSVKGYRGPGNNSLVELTLPPFPTATEVTSPVSTVYPLTENAINWKTTSTTLRGDSFAIQVNGKTFDAQDTTVSVQGSRLDTLSTLEASWLENNTEMRVFMSLSYAPGDFWRVTELKTYDGKTPGNWISYPGFVGNESGKPYSNPVFDLRSKDGKGRIQLRNMRLDAFVSE